MKKILTNTLQVVLAASAATLLLLGVVFIRSQGVNADTTPAPPVISAITNTASTTGVVITWTTDQPASSQVAYGTTTDYGSFSTLDTTNVTSHTVNVFGLVPDTTYHFQILSSINSTTTATSTDQTFMTGTTTASTTDTMAPVVSNVSAAPTTNGATVTWTTDEASNSQVFYGLTTSYGSSSTLDTGLITNHSTILSGLTPSTLYHYMVVSTDTFGNSGTSTDFWFMTLASSTSGGGGTGTSTDLTDLQNRVTNLEDRVTSLEQLIQNILGQIGGVGGGGTSTPTGEQASVDQPGSVRAGTNTDFGGHNFGSEEHIKVMQGGSQVATAFTNLAGGFSTGSVTVPSTPGSYTYTFTGLTSGKTASVTITVIP
jgi:hypothetical protein